MSGFWYVATPYSLFPGGIEAAWREACRQTALLIKAGVPVYSPIAHTHPIAIEGGIDPLDHTIWLPADQPMMEAAHGLIVCMMDGWRDSYGITVEIEAFKRLSLPIVYMQPGAVPVEVLPDGE